MKIENLGREIQNTKVKMSFQMAAATDKKKDCDAEEILVWWALSGGAGHPVAAY